MLLFPVFITLFPVLAFLWNPVSKMLYLGRFLLIGCAMHCAYALICDVSTQYIYEDSTGRIKSCPSCKACPMGEEPYPPCGSVVGLFDQLRRCKPCKKNFHSANKDFLPCQPCRKLTCVANERVEGNCEINKPDTSSCTGHCKKGYIWNSDRSACVLEPKPGATKDSGMPVESVVGIVIGVVVFCAIVIVLIIRHRNHNPQSVTFEASDTEKNENSCNDKGLPKMASNVHVQEECKDEGQSIDSKPFSQESTRGFVDTKNLSR